MSKYRVVCIEKDDTVREAIVGDSHEAHILCSLLKDLIENGIPDIFSLTIYEDEKVIMHEVF